MNMKRIGTLAAAFALTAFAACALAGCGASLDREVTVQDITFKVPKTWLESPGGNGSSGAVVFTEDNEDLDEDETGNSLTISYEKLGAPTSRNRSGLRSKRARSSRKRVPSRLRRPRAPSPSPARQPRPSRPSRPIWRRSMELPRGASTRRSPR